jgi:hypothetical protein
MIGSVSATAVVAYRGMLQTVPRDLVRPVTGIDALQATVRDRPYMPHAVVLGMPGAIVDVVA